MSRVSVVSKYKIFKFEIKNNDGELIRDMKIIQTSYDNALSKAYQNLGGRRLSMKKGIRVEYAETTEIIHYHGELLLFQGKEGVHSDYSDFTFGKLYQVQKSGAILHMLSDDGRQCDVNPIVFKKTEDVNNP